MKYTDQSKITVPSIMLAALLCGSAARVSATPYASGITNNSGTISFFLNEDAKSVNVILDNGAGGSLHLGALPRGKHSFALGTSSSFNIEVLGISGSGWKNADSTGTNAVKLQISSSTNRYLNLEQPRGLKVNKNPSSPYFGRFYAANGGTAATANKRPMQMGVYMLNPDQSSAHPAGLEDTALTGGLSPSGTPFPYELTIGPDDNLYWCDFGDATGNLWVTDANITAGTGVAVLKPIALNTAKVPVGLDNTHGSINAAHVEGSLATGDLTVWTIDEDLQTDRTKTALTELNSLWRFDIGAGPLPYLELPTKIWTASGKQGVAYAPQTMDMVRSTNGNFYITNLRSSGGESGLSVVDANGTPLWNSWTASQAVRVGADLLLNSQKVAVSPDNKYIAVARAAGIVSIMPLVDGLPQLSQILYFTPFAAGSALRGLDFDAANNLYVESNSSEMIAIFSPGGTTLASTSYDTTAASGSLTVINLVLPSISGMQVIDGNVQINFTGAETDDASSFKLQSASAVNGTYADETATITSPSAGVFQAIVPVNGTTRFYRIQK